MTQRILVAGDTSINEVLYSALAESGYQVSFEGDKQAVLGHLAARAFDLLILDLSDAHEAAELLKGVRSKASLRSMIILTIAKWGTGQPTLALSLGADAFEPKPIDAPRLVAAVEKLLRPRMARTAKASVITGDDE